MEKVILSEMAIILDGKKLAQEVLADLALVIKRRDLDLRLVVISVGRNKVSQKYLGQKKLACERAGIGFKNHVFQANITERKLKKEIGRISQDKNVSGLVVQLPLPKHLSTVDVLNSIPSHKDPDCLTAVSFGQFALGQNEILPPVVAAVRKLLQAYKLKIEGKKILVVGQGRLVGQPLIAWLSKAEETGSLPLLRVLVADKSTRDLPGLCRQADIIISGAGKSNLIKGSMVKMGAVVVDCGTSTENGRTFGDVEFSSVIKKAGFVSPVPGGVGPLAVACLLENLVKLSVRR